MSFLSGITTCTERRTAWRAVIMSVGIPLLFSIHPILALYVRNMESYVVADLVRPLAAVTLLTVVLWVILGFLLRSREKSALALGALWLLLFSYRHAANILIAMGSAPSVLAGDQYLLPLWAVLLVVVMVLLFRTRRPLGTLMQAVGAGVCGMCLVLLVPAAANQLTRQHEDSRSSAWMQTYGRSGQPATGVAQHPGDPNIYLVILDGYPRADVLKQFFGYDNRPFLRKLEALGFTVSANNYANYSQTALSLASMLNMDYLDAAMPKANSRDKDRYSLRMMIRQSKVAMLLRERGYKIAAFPSGYAETDLSNADYYLALHGGSALSEFEFGLLNLTPLSLLNVKVLNPEETHRQRTRYILDHMADPIDTKRPVFVFIHLFACHIPFVFGPHGEARTSHVPGGPQDPAWVRKTRAALCDQLTFINAQLLKRVAEIQRAAGRPTIILLQGDHGTELVYLNQGNGAPVDTTFRSFNMSAYYFPPQAGRTMRPIRTPVNLFREIMRRYFNKPYPPLPDKAFFSDWNSPYRFMPMTP